MLYLEGKCNTSVWDLSVLSDVTVGNVSEIQVRSDYRAEGQGRQLHSSDILESDAEE